MNAAMNIATLIFVPLGLIMVLLATGFFSNWSETALVNASFGVLFAAGGLAGAYLGRNNIIKALLLGILGSIFCIAMLVLFFQILWPLL